MKKLLLLLFISLSFCLEAQIQMSQVNGLIPKLKSKQDTIHFPSVRTGDTFLNDLGLFSAPPSTGGSASGTPLYFLPTNSPTSGFLELGYTPYASTVEIPYSIPVGTTFLSSHLYDLGIATTNIDAGNWFISSRSKVNNLSGSVKLHVDFFLYHTDGTKTILFGGDSEIFSTTEFKVYSGQLPKASFNCVATDRIGVDIYAVNSGGATKTLTTSLGSGIATFFSTPLRERHSSLRDKNGESAFQHVTTDQISTWNAKQPSLYGVGFIKANGSTISYDPQTYLTIEALSPYITTNQANAAYEYKFAQGYPNQYLRGDKTWQLFPTTLSSFTNDLGNYGGWITGINSSMVTTALGYTPWYSGNHPTTVSGYGITDIPTYSGVNFIQNQNSSAQSANMWISGVLKSTADGSFDKTLFEGSVARGNTTAYNLIDVKNTLGSARFLVDGTGAAYLSTSISTPILYINGENASGISINRLSTSNNNSINFNSLGYSNYLGYSSGILKTGVSADINSTGFTIYHSGNLTNNLSTNYLPKWNGSSFANSLTNDDGNRIYINSITSSTSPTTGALVVGGGIGVGGVSHFGDDIVASSTIQASEFVKSGGTPNQFLKANGSVDATSYQPSITLTTNGTSGAATFSGNVLNVPNYSGGSGTEGGAWGVSISNVSGASSIVPYNGFYTKTSGVTSFTFRVSCVAASGSCIISTSLPTALSSVNVHCSVSGEDGGSYYGHISGFSSSSANIFLGGFIGTISAAFTITITYM